MRIRAGRTTSVCGRSPSMVFDWMLPSDRIKDVFWSGNVFFQEHFGMHVNECVERHRHSGALHMGAAGSATTQLGDGAHQTLQRETNAKEVEEEPSLW